MAVDANSERGWAEHYALKEITELRMKVIAQRREIISLLRRLGDELAVHEGDQRPPKWIRDRLRELGEDI